MASCRHTLGDLWSLSTAVDQPASRGKRNLVSTWRRQPGARSPRSAVDGGVAGRADLFTGFRIRAAVREQATPRHVPAVIRQIGEVPVTINGKKVELAVTRILHGEEVNNKDALANPEALAQFEGLGL